MKHLASGTWLGLAAWLLVLIGAGPLVPVRAASGDMARPVRHVFIIVLENEPFAVTFGEHSIAPYLAHTLTRQGALLTRYYGTGHDSLDNYISMISGQAPNRATQHDCHRYVDFRPSAGKPVGYGQLPGEGCIYPAAVKTVAGQLQRAGFSWKGYMEDMGNDPSREADRCGHAEVGSRDHTNSATPTDSYADKHDPFVYFHAIIDKPANCRKHIVRLSNLAHDLKQVASTPNYAFITPGLCHDGHNAPCRNGEQGGLISADAFLRHWVPLITASPAFRRDGVLIITFDEGTDDSACCNEHGLPGGPLPGLHGPGGGRIGAVVLSPLVKPGTVSTHPYNHYSLLRSVEQWFGLSKLGYAGAPGVDVFGSDVFTRRPSMPGRQPAH